MGDNSGISNHPMRHSDTKEASKESQNQQILRDSSNTDTKGSQGSQSLSRQGGKEEVSVGNNHHRISKSEEEDIKLLREDEKQEEQEEINDSRGTQNRTRQGGKEDDLV